MRNFSNDISGIFFFFVVTVKLFLESIQLRSMNNTIVFWNSVRYKWEIPDIFFFFQKNMVIKCFFLNTNACYLTIRSQLNKKSELIS